jgi:hypothetical protein
MGFDKFSTSNINLQLMLFSKLHNFDSYLLAYLVLFENLQSCVKTGGALSSIWL